MAINEGDRLLHWNYFLALESDIERLARFVEFTDKNFLTYSIEMAHLFLAAASETEVVAKQLCSMLDSANSTRNAKGYCNVLRNRLPEIENSIVTIPRYGLELRPWSALQGVKAPDWWDAYNSVKHQRHENFALANLKNVLDAMAGLFLLILYYYRGTIENRRIEPPPSLFTPPANLARVCPTVGGPMALFFNDNR